jgi:hypothetical protein
MSAIPMPTMVYVPQEMTHESVKDLRLMLRHQDVRIVRSNDSSIRIEGDALRAPRVQAALGTRWYSRNMIDGATQYNIWQRGQALKDALDARARREGAGRLWGDETPEEMRLDEAMGGRHFAWQPNVLGRIDAIATTCPMCFARTTYGSACKVHAHEVYRERLREQIREAEAEALDLERRAVRARAWLDRLREELEAASA